MLSWSRSRRPEPAPLVVAGQLRRRRISASATNAPRVAPLDLVPLAAGVEPLGGELADRVEHPEARLAVDVLGPDEALVGERRSGRRGRRGRRARSAGPQTASALSSSQPPTKTDSRASRRRSPGVEQVVAPGDRAAQRLLALGQVARSGGQDAELMLEALEDRVGREELDAGRGELDRERHAVEAGGDAGHGRGVLVRDLEVRPDRRSPGR